MAKPNLREIEALIARLDQSERFDAGLLGEAADAIEYLLQANEGLRNDMIKRRLARNGRG